MCCSSCWGSCKAPYLLSSFLHRFVHALCGGLVVLALLDRFCLGSVSSACLGFRLVIEKGFCCLFPFSARIVNGVCSVNIEFQFFPLIILSPCETSFVGAVQSTKGTQEV